MSLDNLYQIIKGQNEILQEFIALLRVEQQCLTTGFDIEDVQNITLKKSDFAKWLNAQDLKRINALDGLGFKDTKEDIEKVCLKDKKIFNAFSHMWALVDQARTLNESNGQVLVNLEKNNSRAIKTLKNLIKNTSSSNTYTPKGRLNAG